MPPIILSRSIKEKIDIVNKFEKNTECIRHPVLNLLSLCIAIIARLFQSSQINLLRDLQQHLIVLRRVSLMFDVVHQNVRNE